MTLIRSHFGRRRPFPVARAAFLSGAALCVMAITACQDPFAPTADQVNESQSFTIYAISGTPVTAPAGLSLSGRTIVRVDGSFGFDLAFDINAQGQPVVLPVNMVGTAITGSHAVGLKRVSGTFVNVTEAPRDGYVFDSTQVMSLGAVLAVQSQSSICSFSFTPYVFAKVTIDSVNPTTRALYGRTLINLNCGFRQLTTGIPTF